MALRPKANLVVLDPGSGKARPGAMVSIYQANTTTFAALYADDDVSVLPNPIAANGLGQVSVRLAQGTYDVSMTFEGALPNVVEDVSVIDPGTSGASSIPGAITIGGDPPTVLSVGADGQVLTVVNGMPAWASGGGGGGGAGLPAGPTGSLFTYDATVAAAIISPGLQGQALAMQGGMPTWVSSLLPPGSTIPISQPGDLVVGAVTTGAISRLARGNIGDVLTTASTGGLAWAAGGGGGTDSTGDKGRGACVLIYTAPNLVLTPFQGNGLWVNGGERIIPDAGITLAPTGLSPNTTYWIYAAVAGTTLALEASLTAPAYAGGFFTMAGDPSRTFVGMARTIAGPSWVYSDRQLFIYNFFHPSPRRTQGIFTANRTINYSASTEVHPEIKVEYLTFGNAQVTFALSGMMYPDPNITTITPQAVFVELMGSEGLVVGNLYDIQTGFDWTNIAMATQLVPSFNGYHWVTLNAWGNPAATVSFKGEVAGKYTCRLMVNAD